ncbi:imidazolonepropionase, partial [Muriicola sp.]|uniref:imidazolonepropionase n=1 Tax=Muriicola sp. TaxID=2020856 RepID=UPI003C7377A1
KGPVSDNSLTILTDAGILMEGEQIHTIGKHRDVLSRAREFQAEIISVEGPVVAIPGLIDCHTHICFSGSRARDYALRNAGSTYLEIAKAGGGIWDTVTQTRAATLETLTDGIIQRANSHLQQGITTIEVKSGYGLSLAQELKMLQAIVQANTSTAPELISTCLAAHMFPKDFEGSRKDYLELMANELLPKIRKEKLSNRVDAFIEEGAFSQQDIAPFFKKAISLGFDLTVHADQFSVGGSEVAIQYKARSADHLEASGTREIENLAKSDVIAVALPGASLGLGCNFTPARALLDAGASVAIASDHNPGSAPMGQLITQAAVLGAFEKLTTAEVLAGITYRAAAALGLKDRGMLAIGKLADLVLFKTPDHREILYHQGSLHPSLVIKNGSVVYSKM